MGPLASDNAPATRRLDPDLDPDHHWILIFSGYSWDILWHFDENSLYIINEMSQLRSFMNHSCQTQLII